VFFTVRPPPWYTPHMANAPNLWATEEDDDDAQQLGQLLGGWMATQVVRTVALLGIPDQLAVSPRTAAELAAATGTAPDPLARLLCTAAVYGLVTRDGEGRFALTGPGGLLRGDVPGSMRDQAVGFFAPPLWDGLGKLADVVRGDPVNPRAPGGAWDYFQRNPGEAAWFARAMSGVTTELTEHLRAMAYGLPAGAGRVVDVGGSRGALLAYLIGTAPAATGVLFDRAEAMTEAPGVLAAAGVAGRAEITAGSFFETVPPGDVHVLANVLHDWDDDAAGVILRNCHRAGRPGGTLIVFTLLLTEALEPPEPYLMDLLMMAIEGGRERTLTELSALAGAAGFELIRDVPVAGPRPYHAVEFRRGQPPQYPGR
jgi:SAM-dependent methyltransferase